MTVKGEKTAVAVSAAGNIEAAVAAVTREKKTVKKVQTDNDVKRKAVKLVVAHLRKKLPETGFIGKEHIIGWIEGMEEILLKDEFVMIEYIQMRRSLNDVIERTVDEELRFKLRDSWYSLGKALDKKVKQK
jgi:hypothetical protein